VIEEFTDVGTRLLSVYIENDYKMSNMSVHTMHL